MQKDTTSLIRSAGFRATKPRLALLDYFKRSKYPQTIQEIASSVPKVDPVTVYRIVDGFTKAGLVRQVDLRQGRPCYEIADIEHDHHHVVCTSCSRVEDFEGCEYESMAKKALKQVKGFATIESHSIELFGLCKACA